MFVYNVKLNSNTIFKFLLVVIIAIAIIFTGISIYRVFVKNPTTKDDDVYNITSSNYTNVLKAVHENLDTYIGQKICFSGYIYRVYDLEDDEFVLARDMIIDSSFQTLIVGFLCKSENLSNFKEGSWVSVTGTIKKGYYHGDIPIIEIIKIEEVEKPTDCNVYPPDDYYIPTSTLLQK